MALHTFKCLCGTIQEGLKNAFFWFHRFFFPGSHNITISSYKCTISQGFHLTLKPSMELFVRKNKNKNVIWLFCYNFCFVWFSCTMEAGRALNVHSQLWLLPRSRGRPPPHLTTLSRFLHCTTALWSLNTFQSGIHSDRPC